MALPMSKSRDADMQFIRASMKIGLLSKEEEQKLARNWQKKQDQASLHKLVSAYLRLVVAIAHRFKNYGLPMADIIQEGNIGLMQAAARFEVERDLRFSTYASWWIRAQIQDYILRNWSIVRTGTTAAHKSLFFNFNRLRSKIDGTGSRGLNDDDRQKIAVELGVSDNDVKHMERRLSGGDYSLSAHLNDDSESTAQDFLADERPNPEEFIGDKMDGLTRNRWLAQAMQTLSERERFIIHRRRLIDDGDTLEVLGRKMGVSKERVRQLETRAMQKLSAQLRANVADPKDIFTA
jgi:RNA polymerase sigma-32 factor